MGWKGTRVILNELGTEVMGLRVRFWGQEVMVGLGLGWEGTNVILKGLGNKVMGFQVGFWGMGFLGWGIGGLWGGWGWDGRAPNLVLKWQI